MSIEEKLWYQAEAARLLQSGDVNEIAICLEVRDAACALYVRMNGSVREPDDSVVIAWLDAEGKK